MFNKLKHHKHRKSSVIILYIWITANSFLQISILIYGAIKNKTGKFYHRFFGLSFQDEIYNQSANIIFAIYKIIYFTMPIFVFTVFYVIMCFELRAAILNVSNSITLNLDSAHDEARKTYNSIRSIAEFIDQELSFLVFCITVLFSSYMYDFVVLALHAKTFLISTKLTFTTCLFLNSLSSFLAMAVSASLLGEASLQVGSMVRKAQQASKNQTLAIQKFLLSTEKEINLTVWKIVPIRRNFIIGTIGALFTYVVLFDNLNAGCSCK